VSSGVVGERSEHRNLDLQNRITCLETERKLNSEVGDFLLVTPAKLVLPEVASRAALTIEEYRHGLENLISRYDICLKVFGDYVEK
jgi:hypothetical protein